MSSIDELAKNFKSLKELRQYCNSQYSVILSLNKKIVQVEEENKHLKELLAKSTPILDNSSGQLEVYKDLTDELAVCIMQIKIMREKSLAGELTFEDAKKLDIYTKLLIQLKTGKKPEEAATKALSDEELLKLINDEISNQNG
jgi:hypothetical protein